MRKVWVVSILVVAASAGGALLLFSEDASTGSDGTTTQTLKPPRPLREAEVRLYMKIQPMVLRLYGVAAQAFGGPKPLDVPTEMARLLKPYHMTPDDWATLRERVEYVVDIQRFELGKEQRRAGIETEIRKREKMLQGEKNTHLKDRIRADIKLFKSRLNAVANPISDSDRAVTQKFWATLSKLVPAKQAPPRKLAPGEGK